VNSERGRNS